MKSQISFSGYSMWTQKKYDYDWHEWCVYVDEEGVTLNTIESVQYTLHPSFPDPIRLSKNRLNCFAIYSAGWGGFSIPIQIKFSDGSVKNTEYELELQSDNWPKKEYPNNINDGEMKVVYQALSHEKFRWRKLDTIVKKADLSEEQVLDALNKLEKSNLARKAYFLSVDNQELWGSTAIVGVAPRT